MQTLNRSRHDVVIVGGRVAGSATAMLLARLGHDVMVVDQASFPSDTVSTHSIARSGVVQLHRWGLLDEVLDSGAPAIRQITFHAFSGSTRMSATATSGSPCGSRSRATPRPRSCARSWRSHGPGLRSTTSSPTGCPSPSRWRPPDARKEVPQPGEDQLAVSWLRASIWAFPGFGAR